MIRIRFTMDSKRRGQQIEARTLNSAKRQIRCARGKKKTFTPEKIHGYPKAWEVTCGDTVVADAMQLPPGARRDYFPRYQLSSKKSKRSRR